mmetsp:Transcript_10991/g.14311  ORF Transcript_10991/g.14311 Transcript_10991/m.14311 type:complete len:137 (-) Transcript_10991:1253-1663(-)
MSDIPGQVLNNIESGLNFFGRLIDIENNEPTPIRPVVHSLAVALNSLHSTVASGESLVSEEVENQVKPIVEPICTYVEKNPEMFGFSMAAAGGLFTMRKFTFSPRRFVRGGLIGGLLGFGLLFRAAKAEKNDSKYR